MGDLVRLSTTPPPRPPRWLVYPVVDREGEPRSDVVVELGDRYEACVVGAERLGLQTVEVDAIPLWGSASSAA
jgi:hypothetical protein